MTDVKLLTEAEWRVVYMASVTTDIFEKWIAPYRERGLIAPEPVDPLLIEAREIAYNTRRNHPGCSGHADKVCHKVRVGQWDDHMLVVAALTALKRGMELAQPPLTREMVRALVIDAQPKYLSVGDFQGRYGKKNIASAEGFITRLHAMLSERRP